MKREGRMSALAKAARGAASPLLAAGLLAAMSGCSEKAAEAPAKPTGPAMMPQSQVVMFGAGSSQEGERLYGEKCAFCHAGRNTGTIMLGRRLDPATAELHKRTDLQADYVKAVVRNGLVNMPPLSRVEVSDEELDRIAAWLARNGRK